MLHWRPQGPGTARPTPHSGQVAVLPSGAARAMGLRRPLGEGSQGCGRRAPERTGPCVRRTRAASALEVQKRQPGPTTCSRPAHAKPTAGRTQNSPADRPVFVWVTHPRLASQADEIKTM